MGECSCGEDSVACLGFGLMSRWWRVLLDRKSWFLFLLLGGGIVMWGGYYIRMLVIGKGEWGFLVIGKEFRVRVFFFFV